MNAAPPPLSMELSTGASPDLGQVCTEAGWAFTARPDGSVAVELRAPEAYGVAAVARDANAAVVVSIDLFDEAELASPLCRTALAAFLRRVDQVIPLVRVVTLPAEDATNFRIEVVFATVPSATELDHALAALSVAWGMCSREAEVLRRDEGVAQAYLERSPWSLDPGP